MQLDAHMESALVRKGLRLDIIIASSRYFFLIIVHLTNVRAKSELRRLVLSLLALRVVGHLSAHVFGAKTCIGALLAGTEPIVRCSLKYPVIGGVLAGPRCTPVNILFILVVVEWRHCD